VETIEAGRHGEFLQDIALGAIGAIRLRGNPAAIDDLDIGALARI
jgi:hypothetical protein